MLYYFTKTSFVTLVLLFIVSINVAYADTPVIMVIDNQTFYPYTINSFEGDNGAVTPVNVVVPPRGKGTITYSYSDNTHPSIQLFKLTDSNNNIFNFAIAVHLVVPQTSSPPVPPSYKDLGRTLYTNGFDGYSSFNGDDVVSEAKPNKDAYVCGTQLLVGINGSYVQFIYYSESGEDPPFSHGNYDLTAAKSFIPGIIVVQLADKN